MLMASGTSFQLVFGTSQYLANAGYDQLLLFALVISHPELRAGAPERANEPVSSYPCLQKPCEGIDHRLSCLGQADL